MLIKIHENSPAGRDNHNPTLPRSLGNKKRKVTVKIKDLKRDTTTDSNGFSKAVKKALAITFIKEKRYWKITTLKTSLVRVSKALSPFENILIINSFWNIIVIKNTIPKVAPEIKEIFKDSIILSNLLAPKLKETSGWSALVLNHTDRYLKYY